VDVISGYNCKQSVDAVCIVLPVHVVEKGEERGERREERKKGAVLARHRLPWK